MKKRIYIIILSILAIVIVSTAFIPLSNNAEKENSNADVVLKHPESGYIEDIGS